MFQRPDSSDDMLQMLHDGAALNVASGSLHLAQYRIATATCRDARNVYEPIDELTSRPTFMQLPNQ
jgi:hypothetical protein